MKMALRGRILALCLSIGGMLPNLAQAQFSNEWINFTQSYYKVPVAKNGVYKISYADLQAAGVPLSGIDPRRINIFHRGVEQAIFVQGQADATFDPADYIEFYGKRNDGTLDADLYKPSTLQPHPYYNLYNDTTAYFLTWNPLAVQGKRMTSFYEANGSGLPKETYHTEERLQVYSDEYSGGLTLQSEIQNTAFDQGEGWTGVSVCGGTAGCTGLLDLILDNLLRPVTTTSPPQLEILLVGREDLYHQVEIYAGPNGGSSHLVATTNFLNFETSKLSVPIAWTDIGADGKMTVRVRLTSTSRDVLSVSYVKVNFSQDYNDALLPEKIFTIPSKVSNKSYVEFLNPPAGARVWDITDPDNVISIGTNAVTGGIGAIVPGTTSPRKLYVSNVVLTPALKKASFRSITPSLSNYIIISHRSLMKPALGYGDVVQAYASYRATTIGGGYDTLTVPIDQLYNQFNYGETSPRAIYQFMKYMVSGGHPKFLFLIGKGLEVSQGFYRKTTLTSADFRDLVPSAGMPGSDMAFTAGLAGTTYEPAVPTGRLTASTPTQVGAYLNKIKETEALSFHSLWRKDILHLSGGIHEGEPEIFRGYVDGFKAIAESFYLGSQVETISKQSLNVELINVKDEVNKGLNLITFFGHSGPGTIDIDIGNVSDPTLGYNNAGKYPGFLINGCNAGRFFDNRVTFGEDWMLTPNKGAKAFIAHSFFGFTNTLKEYSDLFYAVAFGDSTFMKKGIGEVQKETARRYLAQSGVSLSTITQCQQMVLLGDPAVSLFGARAPDYAIDNSSISIQSIDGKPVTAQSPSFALDIAVKNFGRAQPGPLEIKVVRTLNDNTTVTYDSIFSPVLYSEVLRFVMKRGRNSNEFGVNSFSVSLDPGKTIPELDETNNGASINFLIPLNGTKNLFPVPYAIVNVPTLDLVLQSTDLTSTSRGYKIEVDTASTFDSPFLKRQVVTGKVLARLPMTLLSTDSLVYYWRTKLDKPLAGESTDWALSSFVYIQSGPEGWAQTKFPQLNEDVAVGLVKDPVLNRLGFLETVSTVDVKTFGSANSTQYSSVSLKINQEEFNVATQEQPCRNNTLNLIAFDKSSSAPYVGVNFTSFFDPRACGRAPQMINNFAPAELVTGAGNDLVQWVANIKPSDSVVLFSIGDAGYASWSATVKSQLDLLGIGASQLSSLQPGEPFIIFGKKGAASGTAKVFRPVQTPANAQELSVSKTITGRYTEGTLTSVVVGPAQQWIQLNSQVTQVGAHDQYSVDVTGIDMTGKESLLKNHVTGTVDLADISATAFPFLRLTLNTSDDIDLTPVQLRKWLVTYTPMAEGILTYSGKKEMENLQEGQDWKSSYGFTNISPYTFKDSLLVQVDIFSADQQANSRQLFRIKAPAPKDSTKFTIQTKTKGKSGLNDVTVFVNPRVLPEPYYDNNVLALFGHLNVAADKTAPVLDVTIDGRHVTNGDAVSSNPSIVAAVVDRNPFIPKTDTTGINLFLRLPCTSATCAYQRINFSRKDVTWKPATATTDFQVVFKPQALVTGEYALRAEAEDGSGNRSGTLPYEVAFVVTDQAGFTLQSVYPNPSSDAFNFKLLLSGPVPPTDFQLQIYSATGGLIRNFGNEVLSVLHVGINNFSVGATDASGNPLPVGIYLFRMTSIIQGKQISQTGRLVVVR